MSGSLQVSGEDSWRCHSCNSFNRGDHRMCTGCEKWRDLDWNCDSCGFKNFAKRDTCKACGANHAAEAKEDVAGGNYFAGKEGDWSGGKGLTGYQDPYTPSDTSYIQSPSFQSQPEPVVPTKEIPWLCGLCKCENTPQRILCFECSGHRDRVEVRNRAAESRMNYHQPPTGRALSNPRQVSPARDMRRMIHRPDGKIEDQTLDWNCGNCNNRNFAKRDKCYKCSKPRSEVEVINNHLNSSWDLPPRRDEMNYRSAPRDSSIPRGRPMMSFQDPPMDVRSEDRSQDWKCTSCDNRNFAKRKVCNQCKKPRDEVEDKNAKFDNEEIQVRKRPAESMMRSNIKHTRFDGKPEDLTNDWVCGNCDINCFAKKTHCFRCNQPREEVENKNTNALQFERPMVSYPSNPAPRIAGHNLQMNSNYGFSERRPQERPKKKWIEEDKTNDWACKVCEINNFAKRKNCFKCKAAREECELQKENSEVNEENSNENKD